MSKFYWDVLQTFFHSAERLASCPPESMRFWIWRFIVDESLAIAASNILPLWNYFSQAITLSTCIVAYNNALFALLVLNNFAEKKQCNLNFLILPVLGDRLHNKPRFYREILYFSIYQNILEAEGPWFESFLSNVLLVYVCEMIIDIIKHSFIAKFNDIKPTTYSEFLEDFCKQPSIIQFCATINVLYGDQVCGQGSDGDDMNNVISHYLYYLDLMSVGREEAGPHDVLSCAEQKPFKPAGPPSSSTT
ncbi:hypothetical protein HN51_065531 [Arachis hypogaea]